MKKVLHVGLFLFFIVISDLMSFAESKSAIDSLNIELNKCGQDTMRVKLLLMLGSQYRTSKTDSAIYYCEEALQVAENVENKYFQAEALKDIAELQTLLGKVIESNESYNKAIDIYNELGLINKSGRMHHLLGNNLKMMGSYEEASEIYNKALKLYKESDDNYGAAAMYVNIGIIFTVQGGQDTAIILYQRGLDLVLLEEDSPKKNRYMYQILVSMGINSATLSSYDEALDCFQRALVICEELDDSRGKSLCYDKIGIVYNSQGKYEEALEYFFKSLAIDTLPNASSVDKLPGMYLHIGATFNELGFPDKAIVYYTKSLNEYKRLGHKDGMASCYTGIGALYADKNELDSALYHYYQSIKVFEETGNKYGLAIVYGNVGGALSRQKKFKEARESYNRCLEISEEIGDKKQIAMTLENITGLYVDEAESGNISSARKRELLNKAISYGERSLVLGKEIGVLKEQKSAYERMSKAYEGLNNTEKALEYYKQYVVIKDSIFSEEKTRSVAEMEEKYQAEKKQLEIARLEKDKELQDEKMSRHSFQRNALIVGIVLMFVLVILVVRNLMVKKKANVLLNKQKTEIEEKNKDLNDLIQEVTRQKDEISTQKGITEKLQHIDKLKDEFLANTSHELRTPLNGIIGIAESLYDGVAGKLGEKANRNLSLIIKSGKRLTSLVNDLLDFSKLKNKQLEIQQNAVDMKSLVDVVVELCRPSIANKDLKVNNEIPNDISAVIGDENRLQQIMFNLIGNAIKFTDSGSVIITAKDIDEKIEISVRDTGIGIPKEKQKDIFKSFEQVDASTTREYGGTGLGLSVCKQLVELHGGEIKLESELGKGSVFMFSLPKSEEKADVSDIPEIVQQLGEESEEAIIATKEIKSDFRILIVDDEPVNQQVLANYLEPEKYSITQVYNGEDALKLVNEGERFDLMLLDIMMPKMSGYEVCKRIRQDHLPSELPVIMLTAKNQISDLVEGFSSGANDYIAKPFSKNELIARIRTHLKLHKINSSYGRFLPHDFMKTLGKESIIDVKLGDHVEGEMTVMFSDIRSFTTISEGMSPKDNFNFLNDYLSQCIPAIRNNKGFIDKYIGDAVMAIFPDEPVNAIKASLDTLHYLEEYNRERTTKGLFPINIGMGLHTGSLMLGTIGNEDRMDGTVISDAVNLASRVESLSKMFGASIVITENTLAGIKNPDEFNYRFLCKVQVKGKLKPVAIYEFFDGDPIEVAELKKNTRADFDSGLDHYFKKEFTKAASLFEKVLQLNPEDKIVRLYLERSAQFMVNKVNDDWEGVEVMDNK